MGGRGRKGIVGDSRAEYVPEPNLEGGGKLINANSNIASPLDRFFRGIYGCRDTNFGILGRRSRALTLTEALLQ